MGQRALPAGCGRGAAPWVHERLAKARRSGGRLAFAWGGILERLKSAMRTDRTHEGEDRARPYDDTDDRQHYEEPDTLANGTQQVGLRLLLIVYRCQPRP